MNRLFGGDVRGVSRSVITAVVAFVLSIVIFATSAFAEYYNSYKVTICVDNTKFTITTNESQPIEILKKASVDIDSDDRIDISKFKSGKGGIIRVDRKNTINILYDGNISSYAVYGDTLDEALKELGIKCNSNSVANKNVKNITDGMVVRLSNIKSVNVCYGGKNIKYPLVKGTVGDLVSATGLVLGKNDYITPAKTKRLTADMRITVNIVEFKQKTVNESVKYKTVKKDDASLYEGMEKVVKSGSNGKDKVTYSVKYVNGKEVSRTELERSTVSKPVSRVVKVGTKEIKGNKDITPNGVNSKNGYSVGQEINGRYTHYCACGICGSGTGVTASGRRVSNGMKNPYYIACNWLPMGSVVEVDGYNYLVVDRGGSGLSSSGRIDIFTPEGHQACFRYGTGSCKLKIVRLGW